jgi:SAM-dependent methyltransferase
MKLTAAPFGAPRSFPRTNVRVSRRGLFSLGASRLIPDEEDVVALGAAWRGYQEAEAGVEPTDFRALRERARAHWDEGDYGPTSARLAPAARELVEVAGLAAGQTVLDVGAGDGSVAIDAARRGARVTAIDLSPRRAQEGRQRCDGEGLAVDWRVGDVEELPFADDSFDRVLSSFGAMFGLRPRRTAEELLRVTRPGGAIGMANWATSGFVGQVQELAARISAMPRDVYRPARWGRYESVLAWVGSSVDGLEMTDRTLTLEFESEDAAWRELSSPPGELGPALGDGADHEAARPGFRELVASFADGPAAGRLRVPSSYTLVTWHKPDWA